MQLYKDQTILITGGTGSFGQSFLKYCFTHNIVFKEIILFSRDELKHYNLQLTYPPQLYKNINYKIGDIRDYERLSECMKNADIVVHAAAMKHVHLCEENPEECYKTNIQGAQNVLKAFQESSAKQLITVSTDKAVNPTNVYGYSKLEAEKLFLSYKNETQKICIVRYGNVFGASGSVVPTFQYLKKTRTLNITHKEMTRYFITSTQAIETIFFALQQQKTHEIYIPTCKKIKIETLAQIICCDCQKKYTGLRSGEKLHEDLLTEEEKTRAYLNSDYIVITTEKQQYNSMDILNETYSEYEITRMLQE